MALNLNRTLSAAAPGEYAPMLTSLQSNIIKPHVRDNLSLLLVAFPDAGRGRGFLAALADPSTGQLKSAADHLRELAAYREHGVPGTPFVGVALNWAGYRALGIDHEQIPADPAFRQGLRHYRTRARLNDPPVQTWDEPYQRPIHALIVIGDAAPGPVATRRAAVVSLITAWDVEVVAEETGIGYRNANRDGIEHFGYVDGRSQPLFLTEDIAAERADGEDRGTAGTAGKAWDPAFPLDRILVPDPAAPSRGIDHGSYLVFRKLEQDVAAFKAAEDRLAHQLQLDGEDAERAGAMIVGRFEDGTALTMHPEARDAPGGFVVPNGFTYSADRGGLRCPFHAHIRKMNPRPVAGSSPPDADAQATAAERRHVMARRGQTYGPRQLRQDGTFADTPPHGVGLLFMAFNVDIAEQFEHVQRVANAVDLPDGVPVPSPDPVIGQGRRRRLAWPVAWDKPERAEVASLPHAVTMKGGDYFFAPSLAFLRSLGPRG